MHPMVVIYGVMAAGLLAVLVLAIRGKPKRAALLATGIAIPLQVLGLSGTCTQGADFTFVTGAMLSSPFLLLAVGFVVWSLRRPEPELKAGVLTLSAALSMLLLTNQAWVGALVFGTPCGIDFVDYPSGLPRASIVVAGYLVLPLCLVATTTWSLLRLRGPSKSPS